MGGLNSGKEGGFWRSGSCLKEMCCFPLSKCNKDVTLPQISSSGVSKLDYKPVVISFSHLIAKCVIFDRKRWREKRVQDLKPQTNRSAWRKEQLKHSGLRELVPIRKQKLFTTHTVRHTFSQQTQISVFRQKLQLQRPPMETSSMTFYISFQTKTLKSFVLCCYSNWKFTLSLIC